MLGPLVRRPILGNASRHADVWDMYAIGVKEFANQRIITQGAPNAQETWKVRYRGEGSSHIMW